MPAQAQAFSDSTQRVPGLIPTGARADTATVSARVGTISVQGNITTDSARIIRTFEVPLGSRYSDEAVRRGIRKLFGLGLFSDVWVTREERAGDIDLVINVRERPHIAKIEFSGNKKRDTSDLEKKLILRVGDAYSPTAVQTQLDSLLKYYREEGFARVSIDAVPDTTIGVNQVALRFVIREGERVKITRIEFSGATAFKPGKLRKHMKSKTKGFFGGGDVKDENLAEDKEKLEAYYRSNGYRDMRVLGHELQPGDRPNRLTLRVSVEEGRPYRFGNVDWTGNQQVNREALDKLWKQKAGDTYDVSRIERAQAGAYAEYAEKGYLYLNIEPKETARDSVVDITFVVTEGQPSNVRLVNISGNRTTRENVIRREMDVHEGERFKRSALVRTQGDIFRLGLFEDVQIDFAPADSTDVDINLRVKEKQVGTASAGAGYTSESGLTGFVELGHNNVLGNGQSLSLHLERGGRRSDYFLSFTEPWFRGTPTLLGFSLFNTERERDIYEEKRIGGSGRIGRPLPWPDYSRGSISYRLENVTIKQLGDSLSEQDRITLSGVRIGEGVLTSSMELNFQRNSTDNPFYPTKGTRLTLDDELAGGPFGGAVNFHKHRLEGRLYFPSLLKGVTTMGRVRLGLLGTYADQQRGVPPYERFRLGGGTTIDPLRGYDDYQVVPGKFVQDIRDTTGADSGRVVRVRYPGGRFMTLYTVEQQFPIVHPLHAVLFFDAGNTWDLASEIKPFDLKMGAGVGFRLEIPLLGNIGFDYGYGFDRDDGPKAKGHFLIGNVSF